MGGKVEERFLDEFLAFVIGQEKNEDRLRKQF